MTEDLLRKLRALGEPTRLRIVILLARGELTVSELMQILGQSQPRVSRHLKMLTDAGLAERLPEGAYVFYRLAKTPVGGKLGELVREMAGEADPDVARDLERLETVKQIRAATADEYFERMAKDWERVRALHFSEDEVEEAMRELVGGRAFEMHLDIGTGTGRMLELFADLAADGVGVDLSHKMLTVARSNIAKAGLTDRFVRQADAGALPIDAESVDLVTVHQVLHYLDDPGRAVAECARVLKPGGKLIIVDFAPHDLAFLRTEHHHRQLGVHPADMARWFATAGLAAPDPLALTPKSEDGRLTVLIWSAEKAHGQLSQTARNRTEATR
jgi:ubiquinone/menaquinone biosynthesis C-methylase UbiE/DNA-binding transcriptional ArsR family regulator